MIDSQLTQEELYGLFDSLSNWGRWGPDDQLGTLNLITPEQSAYALSLAKVGHSVSCSRSIAPRPTALPAMGALHMMTSSGEGATETGMSSATDWFSVGLHGFEFTHVDALSHVFWNRRMYNDRPSSLCTTERGALEGSADPLFSGVIGRGILIDGPLVRAKEHLDPGEALYPADLDAALSAAGITTASGDLLFVRLGRDRWETKSKSGPLTVEHSRPGLHASCLPWLREHDISVLVSDAIHDVTPSGYDVDLPIHAIGIVAMGLWLLDNAALGALASECAERSRYEFLVVLAPLALRRATGSLVNPLVIF